MAALGGELAEDVREAADPDGLAAAARGPRVVLAVEAPERAVGEKHRAGTLRPGDRRLLAKVRPPSEDLDLGRRAADPGASRGPVRAAVPGAEIALFERNFHVEWSLPNLALFRRAENRQKKLDKDVQRSYSSSP